MALAADAFATGALGRIAGPMRFVLLRGEDLMKKLEIKNVGGTSVAGDRKKKSKIRGGSGSIRPMVVGLKSGKVGWFGSGGADVASIIAGDGVIADVKMGSDHRRQRNVMAWSRWKIPVVGSGGFVGVNVELSVKGQVCIGDVSVLVAENVLDGRKRMKLRHDLVEGFN
jgi:hypothetical protein